MPSFTKHPPRLDGPAEPARIGSRPVSWLRSVFGFFHSSEPVAPEPDLTTAFGVTAREFGAAVKASDRDALLEKSIALWNRLRDRAEAAGYLSDRFPALEHVREVLESAARNSDPKKGRAAVDSLVALFKRVNEGLDAIGTPAEPGAQWRPQRPPLSKRETEEKLKEARARTHKSARSLVDAVRKVIAARREIGVSVYSNFSSETYASYAATAADFTLGLIPAAPSHPGTTKRNAPWGVFKVRSEVRPEHAVDRFGLSPPLPARGDLLDARRTKIRFELLHRGDRVAPDTEDWRGDDADR
jgi:hypothetical protein